MKPRIVISHWVHPEVLAFLREHGEVEANETRDTLDPEELASRCRYARALMAFMPDRIDRAFLAHCPKLRIVAGAFKGHDNVDVKECARRGIWATVVPDLLTGPTAELAVGLVLALLRKILEGDAVVRSGRFQGWQPILYGGTLVGSRVGILGMGRLGRAIAERLRGFGAEVRYSDPRSGPEPGRVSFDRLMSCSDVVIVAAPLTPDSLHSIDRASLARLPSGAILINVGRGSVVDEGAVAEALESGRLGGYAADVFEMEDLSRTDRPSAIPPALLSMTDRTVFTPHLGSAVDKGRREIALSAARAIADVLAGKPPADAVAIPLQVPSTPHSI